MPFWLPAIAAGAAVVLTGKAVKRHVIGQLGRLAVADPDGIRTVAVFALDREPDALLLDLAVELTRTITIRPIEVTEDAVRGRGTDIVRLARCERGYSLTLTRAWTGAQLTTHALDLLAELHAALVAAGVRNLAWHPRQDRELAFPARHPFY
ncbi:MAG TPA: hypothetical protein VIU61_09125 [Kofleriaceae bacterium]